MDTERDCYYARPATRRPIRRADSGRWVWTYALVSLCTVGLVVVAALSDAIALPHGAPSTAQGMAVPASAADFAVPHL